MNDSIVTFGEAEGTRQEILKTTYCTLYEHGLAGLTISKIGKNFNKSSSVIYDYYETKEDLILDLLDCLLEIIEDEIIIDEPFSDTYLLKITDSIFDIYYEPDNMLFQVIAEMRAQAPHNEKLHNRLRQSDILVQERIEYAISIGVQEGMMDIRNSSVLQLSYQTYL